ncbi:GrpB family protein [Streptomyces shenzhenensis]|uniref:GrpB family protein n=1 Tax=Streptomyces shenzhenensis TaxID=943815 RepID=UPI003D904B8A
MGGTGPGSRRDITAALRELPVDVAHIGSTAVPGLAAEPIIDVHVVERRGRLWADNSALRDCLRTHLHVADRYADVEREAAVQAPGPLAYSALTARAVARPARAAVRRCDATRSGHGHRRTSVANRSVRPPAHPPCATTDPAVSRVVYAVKGVHARIRPSDFGLVEGRPW